jgi:hypothetical protein
MTDEMKNKCFHFVQGNYFGEKDADLLWSMPQEVWGILFTSSLYPSYITWSGSGDGGGDGSCEAILTSRPVISSIRQTVSTPLYFWDFLCIRSSSSAHSQAEMAQQLLYTHDYRQRLDTKDNIYASLFCKEGDNISCNGVVPVLTCLLQEIEIPTFFRASIEMRREGGGSFTELKMPPPFLVHCAERAPDFEAFYDILETFPKKGYDWVVVPEKTALIARCQYASPTTQASHMLYSVTLHGKCAAFFVCRYRYVLDGTNRTMGDEDDNEMGATTHTIELMGSWRNEEILSTELFLLGWLVILQKIMKICRKLKRLLLPLRGRNAELKAASGNISQQAWYLYNMACLPVEAERAFVCA